MHNQIFSMKKSSRSIGRRNDKPSPARGEGRLPLSGGDVERSETEGVGDLAAGQTDEGEGSEITPPFNFPLDSPPASMLQYPHNKGE